MSCGAGGGSSGPAAGTSPLRGALLPLRLPAEMPALGAAGPRSGAAPANNAMLIRALSCRGCNDGGLGLARQFPGSCQR